MHKQKNKVFSTFKKRSVRNVLTNLFAKHLHEKSKTPDLAFLSLGVRKQSTA